MSNPVMHEWMLELPWKMQSVLMAAIRGPDRSRDPNIKLVNRWVRTLCFNDADPTNPKFHFHGSLGEALDVDELEKELEYQPVHYYSHFYYALEIIGYKHPDIETSVYALGLYVQGVQAIHMYPETKEQFEKRLADVTVHA